MATKLGGVEIPIKLDLTEAKRQVQQLAAQVNHQIPSTTPSPGAQAFAPAVPVFSAGQTAPIVVQSAPPPIPSTPAGRPAPAAPTMQAAASTGQPSALPAVVQPTSAVAIAAQTRGLASTFGKTAASIATTAIGAAAAYAIASQTVKALPEYFAFGTQVAGAEGAPGVDFMQGLLDDLRRRFVELESKVGSLFTAFKKTEELTKATLRLTGRAPDPLKYGMLFKEEAELDKQLDDKFDLWKSKEAPAVTLQMILAGTKRAMHR